MSARVLVSGRVDGLKPILKRLKKLPEKVQQAAVKPAVNKSSTPIVKDARKRAPKGAGLTPSGEQRTHLGKAIGKNRVKIHKRTGSVYQFVGPQISGNSRVWHAHLVHDGTLAHQIVLSRPAMFGGVVLPKGFVIQHPGARANPFMDQAAEAMRGKSQSILEKEIVKGIEKQVAKLAKTK